MSSETNGGITRSEEQRLIAGVRAKDRDSIRGLVDAYKDRLFAFIWRMTRNHHDAEDVCQESFLKAFASIDSFSSEYRFSTWLFTIGYRVCLNRLRRKQIVGTDLDLAMVSPAAQDSTIDAVESREAGELRDMVWSAVDQLSEAQRAAVLLFYRHDMPCQDIARVLELPVATVKSHLHRGRNRLREILEAMGEEKLGAFRNFSAQAG